MVIFVLSGYERGITSFLLWAHGHSSESNARYVICPALLLLSGGFIALDERLRLSGTHRWQVAAAGVVVCLVALALTSFSAADHSLRGKPTWSSSVARARTRCSRRFGSPARLPVSPFGTLEIPCDRLT